ncbi:hypothetical protein COLO4_08620 [Corchorus olitorius]|uniref:N-acetyltransferase domain-containing protein n=1 Tax=Corchorus olitorius TaxID=93759 RepID=A0A1R3KF52_9ROSI|nr:hypothetical protein COLO4_08620 [Corchorus olitorius]
MALRFAITATKMKTLMCDQGDQSPPRKGKNLKVLKKLLISRKPRDKKTYKPCMFIPSNYCGSSSRRKAGTIFSWMIDRNVVSSMANVYYRNEAGTRLMKGRIRRDGIECNCCCKVFSLTAFETHAGSTYHRPAAFILLDDGTGRSLSDCQKQVDTGKCKLVQINGKSPSSCQQRLSDEVCSVCFDGGDLILCEECPSSFHVKCLDLIQVPKGHWFFRSRCCRICGKGRLVEGCCVSCQQCKHRFHHICLKMKTKSSDWKNYIETGKNWFCTQSYEKIFFGLGNFTRKQIQLGNNLTWKLLKSNGNPNYHGDKLSVALDVMHKCFERSKDSYTGRDVAEDVIFGRESKLKRVDFKGNYTVTLEENGDVATVATVMVHDERVVEMPLVATRFSHRRRGLCRVLLNELEENLRNLGVEKLVLPSLPSALETWTNLGFSKMTDEDKSRLLQLTLLDF